MAASIRGAGGRPRVFTEAWVATRFAQASRRCMTVSTCLARQGRIDEVPAGQRGLSRARRIASGWCANGAQADEQARGATGATGLLRGDSADDFGCGLAAHATSVGMRNRIVNLNIRGEWRIIF
ncbi:hypothetical protein G3O06_41625 [Burkholderia sp. Ac-20345]|uniref:hypothetical protein n=1 Tax=Burkholderia sp. Ac-20345 TaxID=2703891 RepID=UPI00197B0B51|nr:hypothetical protein [Burkholderia sp. Ac-20345]MBN3783965.1 hypothetical protein [Burkholderia sp. Ac-20345]